MFEQNSQILVLPFQQKTQELKVKVKTFNNILQDVGIQLSFNEEPHILLREQAFILRDLEKMLQTSNDKCEEFMCGLKVLCKKEKHFRKVLMLTVLKKIDGNENTSVRSRNERIEQESLMRTFSKVPVLQKYILDILFDEITNCSIEANQDTSWLHLLLNPLSYLPYIDNHDFITTKLLDVLEVASYPAQLEILNSIPEIIPDGQHSKTAKELCNLLDDKDDLTGAIVDCLNVLNLDCDIQAEVQDRILNKMTGGISPKVFPILITFLLTNCKSQNLVQTIFKIRNVIDTLMQSSDKSKEKDSYKILVFHKMQHLAVSLKNVSEALLNMISVIKNAFDHRPVDYLILLMLHQTFPFKKKIIEAIIRKRVQSGLFNINQLEKMFENYLLDQLMKDYFSSIIEIGCSLIRLASEMYTREFSIAIFKLLFKQTNIESVYRRDILDNLVVLAGANDRKTVDTVVNIFISFLEDKETLRTHTISLMKLLEKSDSLDLKHMKQVFNILCTLTCDVDADETMTGMRDEIHMLVKKQLYSTKRSIKHRGIISAVVMARHLVNISTQPSGYIPKNITAISSLPPGTIREAATLLELAYSCTANFPELTGLYYDQVSSMLMNNNHLDKYFMSWLYETTQAGFEQTYVANTLREKINSIELTMQFSLNSASENKETIGLNIGGLTLRNNTKIILLAPHFRLLRVLHYRQNDGALDGIGALLGCPVIMPNVEIDKLDCNEAKQVADSLFHCINWFREILNAFVGNKKKDFQNKVVKRLKNLLEVELMLKDCIVNIPDHKFPMSYFDVPELGKPFVSPAKTETKNASKKFKSTLAVDQTINNSTIRPKKKTLSKSSNSVDTAVFREIDTDLVVLIRYTLFFPDDNISQSFTQKPTLTINELKFILLDYVAKLDTLSHEKDVGLRNLHMVSVLDVIKDFTILLPYIELHLQVLVKKITQLLDETDGRLDVPVLFTEHALDIKMCFGLVLKTYQLLFSWKGFQYSNNLEVLKNLLKSIRKKNLQTLNSAHLLIAESITNISNLHAYCMELSHGVSLVHTIQALYYLTTPNVEIKKIIVSVAEKLLSKQWYNTKSSLDFGKNANYNVDVLIKAYLISANTKTISGLVGTLQKQAEKMERKEDFLPMLASINKLNFHVFYNGLCSTLLQRIKTEVQCLTNDEHIIVWKTTTITMQGLMSIAKAQETKTNLSTFLKKCIAILKVFLSDGIPVLELILRYKPDDVVDIFKTMQTSTRFLHHLCCYSKLTKDSSLMAFVPQFRLTLETLVYRVKAALVANNCSSAFWMGNLKNRDLQGEDILSQSTTITETNEENSDEELPNDDSDTESISLQISSERNGSASSEIFD